MILGHPGHELRVFRFLEVQQPLVYILTDGSGNNGGNSRIFQTLNVLESTGCRVGSVFGRFKDREIYQIMLEKKTAILRDVIREIEAELLQEGIERIVGDACEGYNPTHDLCRYMINTLASKHNFANYDFLLDGPPHLCPERLKAHALWLHLNEEEFERKLLAAKNYPELKVDLEDTLRKHGKAPFMVECIRPVEDATLLKTWNTPLPHYETYAVSKIEEGKYQDIISFEEHICPLALELKTSCAF